MSCDFPLAGFVASNDCSLKLKQNPVNLAIILSIQAFRIYRWNHSFRACWIWDRLYLIIRASLHRIIVQINLTWIFRAITKVFQKAIRSLGTHFFFLCWRIIYTWLYDTFTKTNRSIFELIRNRHKIYSFMLSITSKNSAAGITYLSRIFWTSL